MAAISINHVSIHAQDLERSAAFYEQLLRDGAHPHADVRVSGRVAAPRS